MKKSQRFLNCLVTCGVALAMVSTLAAQSADQPTAKVVRVSGGARYKVGNNDWQPLKLGDVVREGTVIQTASKSRVDFVLGDPSASVARATPSDTMSYQPSAEQNIVRIWENTLLSIDKATVMHTGADVVTETQLDLKAGHITGTVKKMSAASKYEVKIPNGVAGIRGTVYDITAEGVIKVLSGSVVLAYVGPNGSVVTQVIMSLQMFDARTGTLSPLPNTDKNGLNTLVRQMMAGLTAAATPVSANTSLLYVSPH
jgi:hypothetical protein